MPPQIRTPLERPNGGQYLQRETTASWLQVHLITFCFSEEPAKVQTFDGTQRPVLPSVSTIRHFSGTSRSAVLINDLS